MKNILLFIIIGACNAGLADTQAASDQPTESAVLVQDNEEKLTPERALLEVYLTGIPLAGLGLAMNTPWMPTASIAHLIYVAARLYWDNPTHYKRYNEADHMFMGQVAMLNLSGAALDIIFLAFHGAHLLAQRPDRAGAPGLFLFRNYRFARII